MFDWYPDHEYDLARAQLILFTLGMGMTLSLTDFVEIVKRPRSFIAGLVCHLLVIPLIAVLINWLCGLEPGIAVGLLLVAAMPGGALSKFFTYFGRGNMALSISLTGVSTLLTLVTVPIMLHLLASQYVPADFAMPIADVTFDVALCLLAPLGVGLTLGRLVKRHQRILSRLCVWIGLVVVAIMIAGSLGSGRIRPLQHGFGVPLAIIAFCVIGQQLSMAPFRLLGWPRTDRTAVGIETTMRNMNLALLINTTAFRNAPDLGNGVLFVILFYAAAAMVAGLPLSLNSRRQARSEEAVNAQPT
jgi:BASS family bile acid:Na+ symporter